MLAGLGENLRGVGELHTEGLRDVATAQRLEFANGTSERVSDVLAKGLHAAQGERSGWRISVPTARKPYFS